MIDEVRIKAIKIAKVLNKARDALRDETMEFDMQKRLAMDAYLKIVVEYFETVEKALGDYKQDAHDAWEIANRTLN